MNHCRTGGHIRAGAVAVVVIAYTAFAPTATAHCDGNHNGNHPHCETGGPPPQSGDCIPAVLYSIGSSSGDGTRDYILNSRDGSCPTTVTTDVQTAGGRLQFSNGSGFVAWQEWDSSFTVSTLRRMAFSIGEDGTPVFDDEELIYQSGKASFFDLVETSSPTSQRTLAIIEDGAIHVVDLNSCGSYPCNPSPTTLVASPESFEDPDLIGGHFNSVESLVLAPTGDSMFFTLRGEVANDDPAPQAPDTLRAWSVVHLKRGSDWGLEPVPVVLYGPFTADSVIATSVSPPGFPNGSIDGPYVSVSGLGFLTTDPNYPFANGLQHGIGGIWTPEDTVFILGSEGKRKNLVHPIEEVDPMTGDQVRLGITLQDHPGIDSAL